MSEFLSRYLQHGDQKILSQISGISESTIAAWKNDRNGPLICAVKWLLVAMSQYYQVDECNLWLELSECL